MAIELPKDAEGREIPLDTNVLYDKNGKSLVIYAWEYISQKLCNQWRVQFLSDTSGVKYYPQNYYLTPPDSWKKLEEDLNRCVASTRYVPCEYFDPANDACEKCHADPDKECLVQMVQHVARRIHKLKGDCE